MALPNQQQFEDTSILYQGKYIDRDLLMVFYDPSGCRLETVREVLIAARQRDFQERSKRPNMRFMSSSELLEEVIIVQFAVVLPRWKSWVLKKLLRIE